jgi:MFS family permease
MAPAERRSRPLGLGWAHTSEMDGSTGGRIQTKAYRRYVVGFAIASGVVVGIGIGSFIALSGAWWWILFLGIPIGIRVFGTATGILILHDRVAWVWPSVGLAVAILVAAVVPHSVAAFGLGLAVALLVVLIVGAGILDVVVDPDGRQG